MQRRKGAQWERELALYLRSQGLPAKRGIGQARSASEVPDVDLPGWWVEAKRHARTNPKAALAQACADSAEHGGGRVPVAVCRDNGTALEDATVTMRLADWVQLVKDRRIVETVTKAATVATEAELRLDLGDGDSAEEEARKEAFAKALANGKDWLEKVAKTWNEVLP
jgi:hypothetical protein